MDAFFYGFTGINCNKPDKPLVFDQSERAYYLSIFTC